MRRNPETGSAAAPDAPTAWEVTVARADFQELLRAKRRFIVPMTAFFLVYYFTLPILTGYMPELMGRKVLGHLSLAYVFALSQFPMAWIVAALYVRAAAGFDRKSRQILVGHAERGEKP